MSPVPDVSVGCGVAREETVCKMGGNGAVDLRECRVCSAGNKIGCISTDIPIR